MADNAQIYLARRQKVLGHIVAHPEDHDQEQWETHSPSCGTQRCVAGWAVHFEAPQSRHLEGAMQYVADRDNIHYDYITFSNIGRHLLGLTYAEADELFFEVDNEQAVELLRQYAAGSNDVVHTESYDPHRTNEN